MSTCQVVKVGSDRRLQKQFVQLPWRIYRNDPNWIPPIVMALEEGVNFRKNPFYDRNRCEAFVALRDGQVVGRICAIVNQGHIDRFKEQLGFFGFFECQDDQSTANQLFDAAAEYLSAQGLTTVRGPTNPSLNQELGCLVDGYDSPPTFMMSYNPPYYEKLIEGWGFEKAQDLYSYEAHISIVATLDPKLKFVIEEIKRRFNVVVRNFDRKRFNDEVNLFLEIYNR
jgi:hypothetical protein